MPLSEVPRVELNQDGTINLVVDVDGFTPGTPVEISGHVTQENGAVATFNVVRPAPQGGPVTLPRVPVVPGNAFDAQLSVTVVARAAQVWITTLALDTSPAGTFSSMLSEDVPAAWSVSGARWAVSWPGQKVQAVWASNYTPSSDLLARSAGLARRKPGPAEELMAARFTKLFPDLPGAQFDRHDLELLAEAMTAAAEPPQSPDPEENPGLPAAYTYLGQFADHDLSFDPTSQLTEKLSPAQLDALVDFRTPRFDLDNLYGRGPSDQPYLYDDDQIHLLPGDPMPGHPFDPGAVQLPRGPNGRALVGDPRNDENRIVAQLHTIFLRFHNLLADRLGRRRKVGLAEVRQLVRWHYQWILVQDFLPAILDRQTYQRVFADPYRPVTTIPRLRGRDLELMPVEFSVAAYRFGHSMIRPQYRLNADIERPVLSTDPGDAADLGGFRRMPADWAIDWRYFIDLDHGAASVAGRPQLSYKIDTSLVNALGMLPARIADGPPPSLALRDLERGAVFQLPSGQSVARALGLPVIADQDLVIGPATADSQLTPITEIAPGFAGHAPLWVYILSEAQVTSWPRARPGTAKNDIPIRLGPLGGRLVAETFASLLRGDPTSYLNASRKFTPIRDFTYRGRFGLAELINAVLAQPS